jgi:transposase-like protein
MATDPKKSLASPSVSQVAKNNVDRLLQTGLADVSLRELLGLLISSAGAAEREVFLQNSTADRANGFYDRALQVGSVPVEVQVPRTRSGEFRPKSLPGRYQRGYSDEVQSLVLGLLASSRSINAAKDALQKMGLSQSGQELDRVAASLVEELELRNSRPVDPDLIALFMDGKYVELREGDKLRSACIYVVVGITRDGKKHVLSSIARSGRENLEDWKVVLRGLIERGLRRVMIVIQDDFSGLLPINVGLFPNADVQLCAASVATPKPAMCGHFKTGHMKRRPDRVFYTFSFQ